MIAQYDRDTLQHELELIEQQSGKGHVKWSAAAAASKLAYLQAVLALPRLTGALRYALYQHVTQYFGPTVITVARAITLTAPPAYKATVFVDGLPKSHTRRFAAQLRQLGVRTEKVRSVRKEETTALLRLADALCGFVRAALAGHPPFPALLANAQSAGVVWEL